MVVFQDRVPRYPGRVTMTPVSGQANTYDLARADDPVVEGTKLNKALFDSMQAEVQAAEDSAYNAAVYTQKNDITLMDQIVIPSVEITGNNVSGVTYKIVIN